MNIVVVSPHLDDAVLSVGASIADAARRHHVRIATLLAGVPPAWTWPTPFDNASGFDDSCTAVLERRREDREACEVLGVSAWHCNFLDGQYGISRNEIRMRVALYSMLRRDVDACALPLGLAHPDHRLVARLARRAVPAGLPVRVYADLPAAHLWPGHIDGALRGWKRTGWRLEPIEVFPGDLARKREAYECYRSQLRFPELAWENLQEERAWLASRVD